MWNGLLNNLGYRSKFESQLVKCEVRFNSSGLFLSLAKSKQLKLSGYKVSRDISAKGEMERSKNNLIANAVKVLMWRSSLSVV